MHCAKFSLLLQKCANAPNAVRKCVRISFRQYECISRLSDYSKHRNTSNPTDWRIRVKLSVTQDLLFQRTTQIPPYVRR